MGWSWIHVFENFESNRIQILSFGNLLIGLLQIYTWLLEDFWLPLVHKVSLVEMLKLLRLVRLISYNILEFESKRKARPNAFSRGERDASFEFFDDQFWDHQAKANTVDIHVSMVLNEAKELEQLILILSWDTDACISHGYF